MIPSHNESYVSERQKGIFECEFCGTTTTRSFDLTRHKKKYHLAPATTSTSQTATTFTFLEQKPTTSSGAVEESANLVDQSAVLEPFVPEAPERRSLADESPPFSSDESLQFKLESLASLGEREVKSHPKKLLRVLKRLTFKRELKIQKKHLRGQPKSRSRNSWRLPWRASLLTQQTSVRFPQLESKLALWNSSSMCLQQHRLPQMILMC